MEAIFVKNANLYTTKAVSLINLTWIGKTSIVFLDLPESLGGMVVIAYLHYSCLRSDFNASELSKTEEE